MFLRGIDGLVMRRATDARLLALVAKGSPEEAWARRFILPDEDILPYTLDRADAGVYPSTETLLLHSDIHALLKRSGATALLMSASCSPRVHAWARRHRITLLMSDYAQQRRLEDKIQFDAFLRRHGIPRPSGGVVTLGARRRLPVAGRAVVQAPDSMGGEGTYFVDGPADVDALLQAGVLARGNRYLVREYIEGRPYGITIFVAPGTVALSPVRLQCYHPSAAEQASRAFAGIQWVPTADLSPTLRRRIDATFLKLGALLYQRRFFGFANVDFMVDARDRVRVIECNPRMSAATPQLLGKPKLLSGIRAAEVFLDGFPGPRAYPRRFARLPMPESAYRGATLDVVPPHGGAVIRREHFSGAYILRPRSVRYLGPNCSVQDFDPEIGVFSFARIGQACDPDDTLATILSNAPLYDERGEMLPTARRLLATFRYTDEPRR
jgi:glutathione synthase/RimK-type ligase-like ATP-grasp enzyme